MILEYEIFTTQNFDTWLQSIKDNRAKARILNRIDLMESGHFGDHKSLGKRLYELRLFYGPGYRVYYTLKNRQIVLLVSGGDKSTQERDIRKAYKLIEEIE